MLGSQPKQEHGCYAVELHCHLDGCVTPEIVFAAAKRNNIKLPSNCKTAEDLIPHITCLREPDSLKEMLDKLYFYLPIIAGDSIAIKQICHSFAKQQYTNKIYYSEVRYCPHLLSGKDLSAEQVLTVILQTLQEASKRYGIIIKSILCNMRQWKADQRATEILDYAIKYDDVIGIDLAGDESASDSTDGWKQFFFKAKFEHKLNITVHAGEALGPQSVFDALDNLYADRIGHGYSSLQNRTLLDRLQRDQIHLECCPTSSICTKAVELKNNEWGKHPIALFQKHGINFGVNSDDPMVLNCCYSSEVDILIEKCGLSKLQVIACWMRAANAAFLNDSETDQLVKEIECRVKKYYLNEYVSFDSWISKQWKIGSKVEVYSASNDCWFVADIVGIVNDSEGEWLEVQYIVNDMFRSKQIPRDDDAAIRPFSKASKVYRYIYDAVQAVAVSVGDMKMAQGINGEEEDEESVPIGRPGDTRDVFILCDAQGSKTKKVRLAPIWFDVQKRFDNNEKLHDEKFDEIMGDTVQNVEIVAEKQNDILAELQELRFGADRVADKMNDISDGIMSEKQNNVHSDD